LNLPTWRGYLLSFSDRHAYSPRNRISESRIKNALLFAASHSGNAYSLANVSFQNQKLSVRILEIA
jgi:hypothetical protein